MYYPEEVIEEVRTRNDIVDIVSQYVNLKKKGANYFGLCPFHNEKSPVLFRFTGKADVLLLRMRSRRKCHHLCDGI